MWFVSCLLPEANSEKQVLFTSKHIPSTTPSVQALNSLVTTSCYACAHSLIRALMQAVMEAARAHPAAAAAVLSRLLAGQADVQQTAAKVNGPAYCPHMVPPLPLSETF